MLSRLLLAAAILAFGTAPSFAALSGVYFCGLGDFGYTLSLDPNRPDEAFAEVGGGEMLDPALLVAGTIPKVASERGQLFQGAILPTGDQIRFFVDGAEVSLIDSYDNEFECSVVFRRDQNGTLVDNRPDAFFHPVALDVPAQSMGSNFRNGPSTKYDAIGEIPAGSPISVTLDTGLWLDGKHWFEVEVGGRSGYVWGGLICTADGSLEYSAGIC